MILTKFDYQHMCQAYLWKRMSVAKRNKVGAVLVKGTQPLVSCYNGTAPGEDNQCEDDEGKTKSNVLHAEENVISLCANLGISTKGATLYVTCRPCDGCIPKIKQAGISKIFYTEEYVSGSKGTSYTQSDLEDSGIIMHRMKKFSEFEIIEKLEVLK